ncbi:hypothetical protein K9M50_01405 [Patescibacteria group bacterium]|nr:hypothetical protein [Patescibacteria group bacterium]
MSHFESIEKQDPAIDTKDFEEIVPELYDYAVEHSFDIDRDAVKECLEVLSQYTDPAQAKEDLKKIWDAMNTDSGLKSDLVDFDDDNF